MSKYLHVFSDAPYTHKFIRFIKEYFSEDEHVFIIMYSNEESKFLAFYQSQENCLVTQDKNIYFNFKHYFQEANKVLIHQLTQPTLMLSLLIFYRDAFQKMTWIIWGGDVYFYKYKSNSLKDNILERLRKVTIAKIPIIVSYIKGDYDKVVEVYQSKAQYIKAKYPSPIDFSLIRNLPLLEKKSDLITIMVGNSADSSNEHISAFKLLEQYKDENIKVVTVLSYGGNEAYVKKVLAKGQEIFADKFEAILDYMDFDAYLNLINNSDVCLFNHKRQQGLGNQVIFLALQKKLYISNTTTPFEYYKDMDIDVFATEDIVNMNFQDFIFLSKEAKEKNRVVILNDIDEQVVKKEWEEVFR